MMLLVAPVLIRAGLCESACAGAHSTGLPRRLTAARNDEGRNKRCVLLIPQLCNPQAAVVSPARRINQTRKSSPPYKQGSGRGGMRSMTERAWFALPHPISGG